MCGATLIAPQFAITAAHCIFGQKTYRRNEWGGLIPDGGQIQGYKKEDFLLVAEAYIRGYSKHKRSIKRIYQPFEGKKWYPRYHPDLVVLEVVTPFPYKKRKIQPACLPSGPVKVGARCHTIGWGKTCPERNCTETKELQYIKKDVLEECPRYEVEMGIAITHKVYNKYQGPKIVAPFHLFFLLKSLDDFKI